MIPTLPRKLLLIISCLSWVASSPPPTGVPCNNPEKCPFKEDCIKNPATNENICICRLEYMEPDGLSWKANYSSCTTDYSPWNIGAIEGGKKVASPFYDLERFPDHALISGGVSKNDYKAKFARLGEETGLGGWCGGGDKNKKAQLFIDLGALSTVSMVATQGIGADSSWWTTKFQVLYGTAVAGEDFDYYYYPDKKKGFVFDGNKNNRDIVYNFFDPPLKASRIVIWPTEWNKRQCLRVEVYGRKVVDECTYKTPEYKKLWSQCHKEADCTNTLASYNCTCPKGWTDTTEHKTGFVCESINECSADGTNNCHKDADCEDTYNGFKCTCKVGYQGDGYYCEDKDECEDGGNDCHETLGVCSNSIGSFSCSCKKGYEGDGKKECKDIDECKKSHDCSANAKCENKPGYYECTCNHGYDGNGYTCTDIDECARGQPCHSEATCKNEEGYHICTCKKGYAGSGFWCEDVDECEDPKNTLCKIGEKCYNLVGSYACMCPEHIPRQVKYQDKTEVEILEGLLKNVRDLSVQDWQYSLFYHSHLVQDIYRLVKLTYAYRFKETRDSFYITSVVGNAFSVESYDFRCTEVPQFRFPNLCHKQYDGTEFSQFTDVVDMFLIEKELKTRVFDLWATTPKPTPPLPGRPAPTLPPVPTMRALTTSIMTINGTNDTYIVTEPPPVTAPPWNGNCSEYKYEDQMVENPSDESGEFYPPNTRCVWEIEAPPGQDVYIEFEGRFELEFDPKCYYDFVQIFDGSLEGEELSRSCGNRTANLPTAVRSGHGKLVVVFETDATEQYFGFTFKYEFLNPRSAVICVSYNIMGTLPKSYQGEWKESLQKEEKSKFVPISRLLACKQFPKCNVTRPRHMQFTLEHFRYDRNDKKCIHWPLDEAGANFHRNPCREIKTNLTHTICECHTWGVVGVLGRATSYSRSGRYTRYELGRNCFLSVLLVTIGLIFTLFYLFFKDQWAAAMFEVFTKKEYDSGRLIQMHILFQTLLVELFFCIITFDVEAEIGACYFLALLFYYLLQTVFFWLFVYTLFLQSRVKELFDSSKYNSYRIYLFIGYGVPVVVMLTVSGLEFPDHVEYGVCWLLFTGTSAWGFSSVIVTLGVATLVLLLHVTYKARNLAGGVNLQHRCLRTMFTTFFVLLTTVFGTLALEERAYHWEWMFSLCNMMQGFSITIMYCILRREDAIIRANQIGALPLEETEADAALQKFMDEEDEVSFADMTPVGSDEDDVVDGKTSAVSGGSTVRSRTSTNLSRVGSGVPTKRVRERILRPEEEESVIGDAVVDEPEDLGEESESSEDHEMEFMEFESQTDEYNSNNPYNSSKSTIR